MVMSLYGAPKEAARRGLTENNEIEGRERQQVTSLSSERERDNRLRTLRAREKERRKVTSPSSERERER